MNFLDKECRAKMVARPGRQNLEKGSAIKMAREMLDKRKEEKKDSCSRVHKSLLLVLNRFSRVCLRPYGL